MHACSKNMYLCIFENYLEKHVLPNVSNLTWNWKCLAGLWLAWFTVLFILKPGPYPIKNRPRSAARRRISTKHLKPSWNCILNFLAPTISREISQNFIRSKFENLVKSHFKSGPYPIKNRPRTAAYTELPKPSWNCILNFLAVTISREISQIFIRSKVKIFRNKVNIFWEGPKIV